MVLSPWPMSLREFTIGADLDDKETSGVGVVCQPVSLTEQVRPQRVLHLDGRVDGADVAVAHGSVEKQSEENVGTQPDIDRPHDSLARQRA